MNSIRRGIRNTFRNAMRSIGVIVILAIAIALSISMLIARDAVNAKIASVRSSTGTTISVTPKGFFGFQGSGTPLSQSKVNGLLSLDHVTAVQETLSQRLTTSSTSLVAPSLGGVLGRQFGSAPGGSTTGGSSNSGAIVFSNPVRVVGTNSPGNALVGGANGGGTEKLTSGATFSATSNEDVAIVGTNLATKNKLKVGSTFTAWKTTFTVVGIYSSGSTFADSEVLMPLATVQRLADAANELTGATVVVDNIDNVASVTTEVTKVMGSTADVTSTQATVESQLAPLNSIQTISTYTLIGAVIGAALILLLSMLMIVRDRRREIGVLKAIGAPNRSVITQFIAESTTFTVLGAIVGLIGGIAISSPITSALVSATSTTPSSPGGFVRGSGGGFTGGGSGFTPPSGGPSGAPNFHFGGFSNTVTQLHTSAGWSTLAFAFVAALVIAALASTFAAATIVRIRPAEVLRSE